MMSESSSVQNAQSSGHRAIRYHGRLINKLGLTLAFVLLFAVVLCSFLNFFKFQDNYRQLVVDRLSIVLEETVYNIEYNLGLGLRLDELEQNKQTLSRLVSNDANVSAVMVINPQGDVLYVDGSARKSTQALTIWNQSLVGSTAESSVELDDFFVFASPLVNSFAQTEGYLVLSYEKAEFNAAIRDVQFKLIQSSIIIILLATIIGLVIVYILLRPTLNSLHRMLDSLMDIEAGRPSQLEKSNAQSEIEQELVELEKVCEGELQPHEINVPEKKEKSRRAFVILATTILLIVSATIVSALYQLEVFRTQLLPQEEKKALTIANQVAGKVDYLLDNGVPFDRIRGLSEAYGTIQQDHPDVQYIGVSLSDEQLLHTSSTVEGGFASKAELQSTFNLYEAPVSNSRVSDTSVVVGIDPTVMARSLQEIVYDILAILVVSSLLATELILFIVSYTLTTPLTTLKEVIERAVQGNFNLGMRVMFKDEVGRLGERLNAMLDRARSNMGLKSKTNQPEMLSSVSVNFVRPPLFLLVFSESMSLSFFPAYVDSLYVPIAGLSKSMIIGLPISVFMAIWALSLPFAGQWSDVVGRRRAFVVGSVITAMGLMLTAAASNLWFLLGARCLTAVGYGLVFITAQGFVTDNTNASNRTKGMATFLSGFFSGSLCGAAIGGILSDRIGYDLTFVLSAVLSLASALFVMQFFAKNEDSDKNTQATKLTAYDFSALMKNPYFLIITFFSAIPAKATLTGFLYYSAPMFMTDQLEVSQSSAGRVLMAYGLAIILISPLSAWLVDYLKRKRTFMALGGLLSGAALCSLYLLPTQQGILLSVLLLGVAHAIGVAPQIALLTELIEGKVNVSMGKVIGIFRMTERIGNIAGPIIAAALITFVGYTDAFLWFAGFLTVNVFIMLLLLAITAFLENRIDKPRAAV